MLAGRGRRAPRSLDEERLPFAPASLDLVVSSLALHWANDLVGALIQIRQALKPDGLFIGAILGGATLTELRAALTDAELELRGGAGPRVSPFADAFDAAGLLQRAGFALPVADVDRVTVRYDHALALMADLRAMGETSVLVERRRTAADPPADRPSRRALRRALRPGRRAHPRHLRDPDADRLGAAPEPATAAAPGLGEDAPRRRAANDGAQRRRKGRRLTAARASLQRMVVGRVNP